MGYNKNMGQTALRYLLYRIETDLSHLQKLKGAKFFEESFGGIFEETLKHSRWICKQQIPSFCQELAARAYGPATERNRYGDPSSCFLWMSLVYLVGISSVTKFDIGSGYDDLIAAHQAIDVSKDEMRDLIAEVVRRVLTLRSGAYEVRLAITSAA